MPCNGKVNGSDCVSSQRLWTSVGENDVFLFCPWNIPDLVSLTNVLFLEWRTSYYRCDIVDN